MAKIARKTALLFAPSAGVNGIETFGAKQQTGTYTGQPNPDVAILQSLSTWQSGWTSAQYGGLRAPYWQDRNAVDFVNLYQIAYTLQMGISEWDSGTTYYTDSFCSYNGFLFKSSQDNNIGNQPPSGSSNSYWNIVTYPSLFSAPTRTVLTSGSGTYTPPSGCVRLFVRMIGGGGGGSVIIIVNGTTYYVNGSNGGATTFSTLTCGGGPGGSETGASAPSASGGDINISGTGNVNQFVPGINEGAIGLPIPSKFGGATNLNAKANSGSGGAGNALYNGNTPASCGGSGAYLEKVFTTIASTYSYTIGGGGAGGSVNPVGDTYYGGNGASGIIIIDEFYY